MFKTILNTAYSVLIETVLYICAICVVMGAVSALFTEFGVVGLTQWLINPIMRPIYNMPGVASLGIITTFLSDNPAILALAQDKKTRSYFKKYQTPALCNLGTSFGMGMIVVTFMLGLGTEFVPAIGAGLFGFKDGSNIVVPITSLGAVGAAIGMIPKMVQNGLAGPNEIAVFTAMGMAWSGYLSTHISMMDSLGRRELIPAALTSHTIAGLAAGVVAHYFFLLIA